MSYQSLLSQLLAGAPAQGMPLTLAEIERVRPTLALWIEELGLPALTEEQARDLARREPPGLRRLLLLCIDVLRRRPEIAAEVGLSAAELGGLCRAGLAVESLGEVAGSLQTALRDALLLQTEELARQNRRTSEALGEVAADPAAPTAERQRALCEQRRLDALLRQDTPADAARLRRAARRRAPLVQTIAAARARRSIARQAVRLLPAKTERKP